MEEKKLKIGISACLLGQKVRWDGNHKQDRFLTDTLGQYVTYVPVCPEMECGMGVPREPIRLVGDPASPLLMTTRTGKDWTFRMKAWAEGQLDALSGENLCGYIFKSNSPSCGMVRVKLFGEDGKPRGKGGTGMFARMYMDRYPRIPVEEEGRLHDVKIREHFIERLFLMEKWRQLLCQGKTLGGLVTFHTRQKLLLLSHSEKHYREMGRLVATGKQLPLDLLFDTYEQLMLDAMKLMATVRKHTNVLHHIMGYFRKVLSPDEKQELSEIIESYRLNDLPLIVPVTLLNHYVRKYGEPYLITQTYLEPHPISLKLRNHA